MHPKVPLRTLPGGPTGPESNMASSILTLLQINRPPVKLALLTCQVRPNPEDKRCFDLVTRE